MLILLKLLNLFSHMKTPKIPGGITAVSTTGLALAIYNTYANQQRAKKPEETAAARPRSSARGEQEEARQKAAEEQEEETRVSSNFIRIHNLEPDNLSLSCEVPRLKDGHLRSHC